MKYLTFFIAALVTLWFLVVGCANSDLPAAEGGTRYGYTHQRLDGNRLASGRGKMNVISPIDITLLEEPEWVLGVPHGDGVVWAAVLRSGRVQAFQVSNGTAAEIEVTPVQLSPGQPAVLESNGREIALTTARLDIASNRSFPIMLSPNEQAYLTIDSELVYTEVEGTAGLSWLLDITPLPDARILADERGRFLLLTNPSTIYGHGVLGDQIEAAGLSMFERKEDRVDEVLHIPIEPPQVIEGLAPIWADITGDSQREIIVTLSDAENGAQIVVFSEEGERIAQSEPIGRGNRWRNQAAVGAFGPNGELELVDVRTPHLSGTVEFFQLKEDQLEVVATISGYTSHVIGSRNLDMIAGGDFDGDGRLEVLLPTLSLDELSAIQHTESGATSIWSVSLDGKLSTNIATATLDDGSLAVGVGQSNGRLRIWQP